MPAVNCEPLPFVEDRTSPVPSHRAGPQKYDSDIDQQHPVRHVWVADSEAAYQQEQWHCLHYVRMPQLCPDVTQTDRVFGGMLRNAGLLIAGDF